MPRPDGLKVQNGSGVLFFRMVTGGEYEERDAAKYQGPLFRCQSRWSGTRPSGSPAMVRDGDGGLPVGAENIGAFVVSVAFPDGQRAFLRGPPVAILGGCGVTEMGGRIPVGSRLPHQIR